MDEMSFQNIDAFSTSKNSKENEAHSGKFSVSESSPRLQNLQEMSASSVENDDSMLAKIKEDSHEEEDSLNQNSEKSDRKGKRKNSKSISKVKELAPIQIP